MHLLKNMSSSIKRGMQKKIHGLWWKGGSRVAMLREQNWKETDLQKVNIFYYPISLVDTKFH